MISSACLQPFLDSLSVSGVAITAISAMVPGFLVLALRPFQPAKFVRKQAELELEALESKLSKTLQASSSIIAQTHVFLDGTWKCVYFSPNCEKLFGYSAEEFVADDGLWMSRILPEDQE